MNGSNNNKTILSARRMYKISQLRITMHALHTKIY